MIGTRYVIKSGDTLWSIARDQLGGGGQWPRIWRYNNRREVVRSTGHGIPDPDLIHAGRTILIPVLPSQRPVRTADTRTAPAHPVLPSTPPVPTPKSPRHSSPTTPSPAAPSSADGGNLKSTLKDIKLPAALKYTLKQQQTLETPTATVEFQLTGDVFLMASTNAALSYNISDQKTELKMTSTMHHAFGELVSDNRFIFDPKKNECTVRSMLVSQSNSPGVSTVATAVGFELSPLNPVPKLRFELRLPKLTGRINGFLYTAVDVKFVILVTPKPQPPTGPSPRMLPLPSPVPQARPESGTNWGKVVGVGLITAAGVIVVATVVEDFFTAGAGIADDPASFAAAAALFTRGLAGFSRATAVLPAVAPASFVMRNSFELAH
ncbi:LysM peptidoglycan-binding domain-containing protein [Phyllobacterium sp. OV277]|uniref:LysM peptidoglycan-binding domain-containing protein n=1 Tax=Phyllobacterium sp. OV277 TaxID=1882772 RepID=UPI000891AD7F|nr:LysM peptidoglycan-binding domain-containing protein [Phyllobacterium sp. OV277]SDP89910.1 LysM domain-containing protein [Phyllobacterium sp. OV277]